jgi:hypothetical protein
MTSPFPTEAPELFSVGTQSIVERSKHLGLVWTRRLATVVSATDPANAVIMFDGDTVNEAAVSMLGVLPVGARVYVDIVPPGGNFIVGMASTVANPLFFGAVNRTAALASGTTTSATFVDLPGSPSITLTKAYTQTRIRIDLHCIFYSTLANTGASFGVNIDGTDGGVCSRVVNAANTYAQASGTAIFPFAVSGSLVITGRWLRYVGGGTLTTDGNAWFSVTAQEVT